MPPTPTPPEIPTEAYIPIEAMKNRVDPFDDFLTPSDFYTTAERTIVDEYKTYLEIPHKPCPQPFEWWRGRDVEWPSLTNMALDMLSIPLMSAECERVFSAAGYLINTRRNRLRGDTIEAVTCLRAWQGCM